MSDNFNESFDGEGFNIVFVDDNKLQRKMFIKGLKNRQEEKEFKFKLNFKTAVNCGYAIKLVKKLMEDNERIDLILMDNDFDQALIDCEKKEEFKDDESIYKLCCNNNGDNNGNNGNNTTQQLFEIIGYRGPIYSISSNVDKLEWVNNFKDKYKGTGAVGRNTTNVLQMIKGLIKTPIQPYIPKTSLATTPPNILDTSLATPINQKATKMVADIISEIIRKKSRIVPENGGKKTKKRLKNKNKTNKRLKNGGKKPKK